MRSNKILVTYHCIGLLLLCLAGTLRAQQPNIILCMADDMGWGDPEYNSLTVTLADGVTPHPDRGWIKTPTLNTMASEGIRFDRFYAASAVCSPTRASCLTGRNPFRVGVPHANQGHLGFDESVLSGVLADAGYTCGHFGKWHLGTLTTLTNDSNRGGPGSTAEYSAPWHHGYDLCFATEAKVPTYHPYRKAENNASLPTDFNHADFYGTRYWRFPLDPINDLEGLAVPASEVNNAIDGDDSKLIVDQTIDFVRSAVSNSAPFFAVVWLHTPHKPITDPDGISNTDSSDALKDAIEDMDAAIGRLRSELDVLGVRSNTMFWVTSDNGPEDGANSPNESNTVRSIRSGGLRARKRSLFEGGVRVPGILEWPNQIPAGFATHFPAGTSDYYPTILDYLDLSVPEQKPLDGISLRPVIEGDPVTRTAAMGFLIGDDRSWVGEQYKLINTGNDWELYDLNVDGTETHAVATAENIASQPAAIQNIYSNMLAEFTTWEASVHTDSTYTHSSAPTVTLSATNAATAGNYTITANFNEAVTRLSLSDFSVARGSASNFVGSGMSYSFEVTPIPEGATTVQLPAGVTIDADGNVNAASNRLLLNPPPELPTVTYTNFPIATQTVDIENDVPGDDDNNVAKFTQGSNNDGVSNPFTTTLYVRSSGTPDRQVRAFVQFDLGPLSTNTIKQAQLLFNAHSLNDNPEEDTNLQTTALAAPWMPTNLMSYAHATVGPVANGGSVTSGLDANRTRNYDLDVTEIVQNWVDGSVTNYGFQLRLQHQNNNAGVGLQTNGVDRLRLVVEQTGIHARITSLDPLTVSWNSIPDQVYRFEAGNSPDAFTYSTVVTGNVGSVTTHTDPTLIATNAFRVFRIALPPATAE